MFYQSIEDLVVFIVIHSVSESKVQELPGTLRKRFDELRKKIEHDDPEQPFSWRRTVVPMTIFPVSEGVAPDQGHPTVDMWPRSPGTMQASVPASTFAAPGAYTGPVSQPGHLYHLPAAPRPPPWAEPKQPTQPQASVVAQTTSTASVRPSIKSHHHPSPPGVDHYPPLRQQQPWHNVPLPPPPKSKYPAPAPAEPTPQPSPAPPQQELVVPEVTLPAAPKTPDLPPSLKSQATEPPSPPEQAAAVHQQTVPVLSFVEDNRPYFEKEPIPLGIMFSENLVLCDADLGFAPVTIEESHSDKPHPTSTSSNTAIIHVDLESSDPEDVPDKKTEKNEETEKTKKTKKEEPWRSSVVHGAFADTIAAFNDWRDTRTGANPDDEQDSHWKFSDQMMNACMILFRLLWLTMGPRGLDLFQDCIKDNETLFNLDLGCFFISCNNGCFYLIILLFYFLNPIN